MVKKVYRNSFKKLIEFRLEDYSKDKNGFVAFHGRLDVTIQLVNENVDRKLNFFVKSRSSGFTEAENFINIDELLKCESMFYTILLPELIRNCEIDEFSPNCYLVKNELLIMEDLKNKNFVMGDKPLKPTHIKAAVSALARYHASSILLEDRLGKPLDQVFPEMIKEKLFIVDGSSWFTFSLKNTIALAEKFGLADSVKCTNIMEKLFDLIKQSKKHRNVICHADVHSNNLMFDDKGNCVLIDFQVLRYSPMVNDVLQLLYVTAESDFRKKSENELLKHYHFLLDETVRKNSSDAKTPSLDEIIQAYNDCRLYGKIYSMLTAPLLYINPEFLKGTLNDPKAFQKFMFASIENDENYRNIVKATVEDLLSIE